MNKIDINKTIDKYFEYTSNVCDELDKYFYERVAGIIKEFENGGIANDFIDYDENNGEYLLFPNTTIWLWVYDGYGNRKETEVGQVVYKDKYIYVDDEFGTRQKTFGQLSVNEKIDLVLHFEELFNKD